MSLPAKILTKFNLPFFLMALLLAVLGVAGGGSRADLPGQVVVRAASWVILVTAILFGPRPEFDRAKPIWTILLATVALAVAQLIPVPTAIWPVSSDTSLMGQAVRATGQTVTWRVWSNVPGRTFNALASLVVPLTVLVISVQMTQVGRRRLLDLLLGVIVASTLVGLLQFSGAGFNNPFVNDSPGSVSGVFANRNHFALVLAIGCVTVPGWIFQSGRSPRRRALAGLGLVLLFTLTILATGSRAGIVLGGLALVIGFGLARPGIQTMLGRYPRWAFPVLLTSIVLVLGLAVLLSVATDRAISIDRALAENVDGDMRNRALPVVVSMIREHLPMGSGLGGFDPMFRISEPFGLLKSSYFNHAHIDFLEIALDAGLVGLIVILCALAWWVWASVRIFRLRAVSKALLPKLGSGILLLVIIASIFDYPARTPLVMAILVIAGVWLSFGAEARDASALPRSDHHL